MTMFLSALTGIILATTSPIGAAAPDGSQSHEQETARAVHRDAKGPSLSEIQKRVSATMPGAKYLGFDFDSSTAVYTLKFLRDGAMIWVLVDGRSGNVIGRSR